MKPEYYAFLTAICWAFGSMLEKKGVKMGDLTPLMGTTIRTATSLILLLIFSFTLWHEVPKAGWKNVSLIALGGGVFAGFLGVTFLYTGLKNGELSTILTIAFCVTPILGVILGTLFLNEKVSGIQILGICLCLIGSFLTVYYKKHH